MHVVQSVNSLQLLLEVGIAFHCWLTPALQTLHTHCETPPLMSIWENEDIGLAFFCSFNAALLLCCMVNRWLTRKKNKSAYTKHALA